MAMVVKNNMSAINTLNTLNKNSSALAKSLQKVSSGMKINSAADDASGYAISERMRVQIRGLDQANQNTQNGSSMMKVAEGAVSSTVDILKTLKEKAINAANDTNTDSDRQTIQKELNQSIDQIDDNANVTYNGKYLVDGSKNTIGDATYTALSNQKLASDTTGATKLTDLKRRTGDSLEIASTDKVTVSYVQGGKTYTTTFQAGDKTLNDVFQAAEGIDDSSKIFADSSNAAYQAASTGKAIDSSDVTTKVTSAATAASTATKTYSTATKTYSTATKTYEASDKGSAATKTYSTATKTYSTATKTYGASAAGVHLLTGSAVGVASSRKTVETADGTNAITVLANKSGVQGQISGLSISVTDSEGNEKKTVNAALAFGESVRAQDASEDNAITLQVGTNANTSIKVGLTDMRSEALGLKGSDGTKLNISTQAKANAAMDVLDKAIQKALDQQTTIGSVESRLSYTSSNLTTASENVQSSESTIRDADMAKEMTEYTKNNVLLQAAQSMLAQANQSSSSVLSLLR
jgi:flagellin